MPPHSPLDTEINRCLDDLAHEASYLNEYSLSDSIPSINFNQVTSAKVDDNLQEPNPRGSQSNSKPMIGVTGSNSYLKCIMKRQPGQETDPLLPIHNSPRYSEIPRSSSFTSIPSMSSIPSVSTIPSLILSNSLFATYLKILLQFFWDYILPERIRNYLIEYQKLVMVIIMGLLTIMGLILFFTGNLTGIQQFVNQVYHKIVNPPAN